jgi:hypothetical protein
MRALTSIATGLCAAPLLVLAGFALANAFTKRRGGGSDQTIAAGYVGLLVGFGFAVVGFFVLWSLAQRFVPDERLRLLQIADAVMLVGGILLWSRLLAPDPPLEYPDHQAVLEIEARVPKSALSGAAANSAVSILFTGGTDLNLPHPERIREEDGAVVVPWETTPIRVKAWTVQVIVKDRTAAFTLPLAKRPDRSIEWSGWLEPAPAGAASEPPAAGVTMRFRFLLVPYGSR